MLWAGLIKINKIIKLDDTFVLYINPKKSVDSLKKISQYYKIINDSEIILRVILNKHMLCNIYDKFKIKTTKKFIDTDFSDSNVFIKLDLNITNINEKKNENDVLILVKTMTKTETQINNEYNTQQINEYKYKTQKYNNTRKNFVTELVDICKKI